MCSREIAENKRRIQERTLSVILHLVNVEGETQL